MKRHRVAHVEVDTVPLPLMASAVKVARFRFPR